MGFNVEINSILRTDEEYQLSIGKTYDFQKAGSRIFFDSLPVWLARRDWTPLAEIMIVSQTRTPLDVRGKFKVQHTYSAAEQEVLSEMFRRMYASEGDPYIYLLVGKEEYEKSLSSGEYKPAAFATDGFIHASPANQLTRVANKYYKQFADVRLMIAALERIKPSVKWEPATGGLYPHIYGPLNMNAVVEAFPVRPEANGDFLIKPDDLAPKHPPIPKDHLP